MKGMKSLYILKIEGTGKIPDYIQIRDENFSLIAYFKITNPRTALSRCNLLDQMDEIIRIASALEYGRIRKLDIHPGREAREPG
jgi:hypothetical protein